MSTAGALPREVHVSEVWIMARDGTRLWARLWLPDLAPGERVPGIIDAHPYRAGDAFAISDQRRYGYLAAHGYACLRVDLRGSGNSGGILRDEYLAREQDDNEDVIAWLAGQRFCTGSVGWIGISWGGFAALQVAARRPEALRAIVTICSTDDRYADDVHYRGGALLASDMLPWAATMHLLAALPPDPAIVGEGWRAAWIARMQETPPYIEAWLRHPLRDAYWKHGSVCEDYGAIRAPALIIGGWADGYVDAALRLLDGLTCPRKAIIGPWAHGSPEEVGPGPNIGFLQECLRWFDCWLKGIDTGVMAEPDLRAWMQEWVPPATHYTERPGRWVGVQRWPLPASDTSRILEPEASGSAMICASPQSLGTDAGVWCPGGSPGDWPGDQRATDGASLTFDSAPLDEPLEILGNAWVELTVVSNRQHGNLIVRLCDVAPDGSSLLVSHGILALTHREGHEKAVPLVPGARNEVEVSLKATAHRFPAGHRLRLGVSATYWPWVWPGPEPVELTVFPDAGWRLALPVFVEAPGAGVPAFALPELAASPLFETNGRGRAGRIAQHDQVRGTTRLDTESVAPEVTLTGSGISFGYESSNRFEIGDTDPLSAAITCRRAATRRRGDWLIRIESESRMTATSEHFLVDVEMRAFEGDEEVHTASWHFGVLR